MSAKAMSYVWSNSPYKGTLRLIHLALSDIANDEHGNVLWAAQATIAEKCNCSRKYVNEAFQIMEEDGFLKKIKQGGQHSANFYKFLMPIQVSPEVTSEENPGVTFTDGTASPDVTFAPPGVTSGYTNSIELKKKSNSSADDMPAGQFDAVWLRYPRKVNRKGARAAFDRAVKVHGLEKVVVGTDMWLKQWKAENKEVQFVPYYVTFLNQERFTEVPIVSTRGTLRQELQGNAQLGKNFLPFEFEGNDELLNKLGAKVYGPV